MQSSKFSFAILLLLLGCHIKSTNFDMVKERADVLLDKIADGTAENEIPIKYFPLEQTKIIMDDLKNKCDFKNRQGHFLNEFYSTDKSKVSLIYEYYLKCDSIRFILTYDLSKKIELCEFKLEPIEKDNQMIIDSNNRLKRN